LAGVERVLAGVERVLAGDERVLPGDERMLLGGAPAKPPIGVRPVVERA
jgi:hypothetical protein